MSTATKKSLEKVAEEFSKEVTAELEEGRAQALESLERVGRETSEAVAKIIEAGKKQAESLTRQITGSSELRSRNLQLRAIEEAVGEVFEMAMAKVSKASPAEHEKAITHLLTEGVEFIGPEARVGCSATIAVATAPNNSFLITFPPCNLTAVRCSPTARCGTSW